MSTGQSSARTSQGLASTVTPNPSLEWTATGMALARSAQTLDSTGIQREPRSSVEQP